MTDHSTSLIAKKIAHYVIGALPHEKHLPILQEMYGFVGILNFPQTISSLISMNQMNAFGVSKEMQTILKHTAQLKALGNMHTIRQYFQTEYEKIHQRTIVAIQIGEGDMESLQGILGEISNEMNGKCDFVYQSYSLPGTIIRYKDKIIEYTPHSITKMLKAM